MSETEQVAEEEVAPEEAPSTQEAVEAEPVALAPEETPEVEAAVAEPVVDQAVAEEPVAEEPVAEEAVADEPDAPPPSERVGAAPARQAKVLLCERGHRTVALWSVPAACHARPTRSGPECGRPLYPIGELPEQVQKALNPLKASKKASKG